MEGERVHGGGVRQAGDARADHLNEHRAEQDGGSPQFPFQLADADGAAYLYA
jgi:hypothetical protein